MEKRYLKKSIVALFLMLSVFLRLSAQNKDIDKGREMLKKAMAQSDAAKSNELVQKATEFFMKGGMKRELYLLIGDAYLEKEDFVNAQAYYSRCEKQDKFVGMRKLANAYVDIAFESIPTDKISIRKAISFFIKANDSISGYKIIGDRYMAINEIKLANEYYLIANGGSSNSANSTPLSASEKTTGLSLGSLSGSNGAYASIHGRISDLEGKPLISANAVIDAMRALAAVTDMDGKFEIQYLPAGEYDITFKYIGLQTLVKHIKVLPGQNLELLITLQNEISSKESTAEKNNELPLISVVNNAIAFIDVNKNNAIDAFETCKLQFEIKNTGKGNGEDLKILLNATGSVNGITFRNSSLLPIIKPGATYRAEIPLTGNENTVNGSALFRVKVDEPNGLGSDMVDIEIPTKAFVSPLVKAVDYTVTSESGNNLARRQPFNLQVLVQNTKTATAESVSATLKVPQYVLLISGEEYTSIGSLKGGATKDITYSLIVTDKYEQQTIPITVQLREKHGKYAEDKTINLNLNQALSANKIRITADPDKAEEAIIPEASLKSDVDKNIPLSSTINIHRYALIIGNEDYSSYQSGLSKEVNVDYALNDARIFKEYCIKTLGIPDKQVKLLTNATTGQMNQGFAWLNNLAKVDNGSAELIVYYSGHGLPDETTKEPYLIPVDVSGSNVTQGIALNTVYGKLTEFPAQKITVFLDACFSGGARNQGLVAMKGVKIKPKDNVLNGNMVVFASSSGEESSGVYRDKQHGYMTYYLLKKLQESKGDITYSQLADYVTQTVKKETALNGKIQTPQVNYSISVANKWSLWKVK